MYAVIATPLRKKASLPQSAYDISVVIANELAGNLSSRGLYDSNTATFSMLFHIQKFGAILIFDSESSAREIYSLLIENAEGDQYFTFDIKQLVGV